jgi:thioredoxin-like negative regulator of GroEL
LGDPATANADLAADIGTALLGLGRMADAAQAFDAALKQQPNLERARAGLARARGGQGRGAR